MANDCLNLYLQQLNAKFFDEAVSCKFNLAEKLRRGARVRLFKWQKISHIPIRGQSCH